MSKIININPNFSTTRIVSLDPPCKHKYMNSNLAKTKKNNRHTDRQDEGGMRRTGYFKMSFDEKPLVSVITAVYNGEKYLEQTIKSVLLQTYENVEYIIIDGGSEDKTIDIIRAYQHGIDYWISEPDHGISEAFNKGIAASTGELIGILNSDDFYELNAIEEIVKSRNRANNLCIYHGKMRFINGDSDISEESTPKIENIWKYMSIFHPTMFVEAKVYEKIGFYSIDFRYAMDCELVHRSLRSGVAFIYVPIIISNMRIKGLSDDNYKKSLIEFRKSVIIHNRRFWFAYYYYFSCLFKKIVLKNKYGLKIKNRIDTFLNR